MQLVGVVGVAMWGLGVVVLLRLVVRWEGGCEMWGRLVIVLVVVAPPARPMCVVLALLAA